MTTTNIIVVGAGIVGLATAYTLAQQHPGRRITVLEKEHEPAQHQTGHNSGVLHSGVYYRPGSLKALNCRAGRAAMLSFCEQEGIPVDICGKVIVALTPADVARLDMLHERGLANGIRCELIDANRLRELEPHAAGLRALYLPDAGTVDFRRVCARLVARLREQGHRVLTGQRVTAVRETPAEVIVRAAAEFRAAYLVCCAGLHADRLVAMAGRRPIARIVPFRGEYFRLKAGARHLCRNLIYPVPDPQFPFLGVHFTRTAWGDVECGPNAVLAFAREGYRKTDINLAGLVETLAYPGFRRLARRHWRMGLGEMWRSLSKPAFVRALQRLMPELTADQLEPMPAGVRAQAVAPDGAMLDDFAFQETARIVHVVNAPSPAATAAFSIARSIVARLGDSDRFPLS